jgi:hypothetical protein
MASIRAILPWILLAGGSLVARAPAIEPVLQAELAFARLADQKGIRTAFLAWMTEDARVFSPRMTSAQAQYSPEPGDPGHLVWYPEAMGMARSGDLAWSFGPWTYAVKKGEAILVNGHYLSLWRRQSSGIWRAEADIGIPHAAPERPIAPFAPWDASSASKNRVPPDPRPYPCSAKRKLTFRWPGRNRVVWPCCRNWRRTRGFSGPGLCRLGRPLRSRRFWRQMRLEQPGSLTGSRWHPAGIWPGPVVKPGRRRGSVPPASCASGPWKQAPGRCCSTCGCPTRPVQSRAGIPLAPLPCCVGSLSCCDG